MAILQKGALSLRRTFHQAPTRRDWGTLVLGGVMALLCVQIVSRLHKNEPLPLRPESPKITIAWLPRTVTHWREPIEAMADKYRIDPNLLAIIMTIESGGYAQAHSSANAQGLMQITPPTAQDIAAKFLKRRVATYDLSNPRTNIEFGAAYLAHLRDEFGDKSQGPDWNATAELLAAGYNGGPGAANRLEQGTGLTATETVVYSRDVYNMWRERHAATSPTYDRWLERGGSRLIDAARKTQ